MTVTREEHSGATVLRIRGDVDLATEERLVETVRAVMAEESPRRILLDLSDVGFMSSSGIGYLLVLTAEARAQGSRLGVVSGGNAYVTRPTEAMRLGRALQLYRSVEDALAA